MITSLSTWALFSALFLGAWNGHHFEKAFLFLMMLAAYALARRFDLMKFQKALALVLFAVIALDFFRIIELPFPVAETYLWGMAKRPNILQPNLLACYALLLPWGWWTPLSALMCTSRGALIGWMASMMAQHTKWLKVIIPAALVLIGLLFTFRFTSVTYRVDIFIMAIQDFIAHPFFGVGTGNFVNPADGMRIAHNAALTIAAENGLSGLIPFIAWVIGIFIRARKSASTMRWGLLAFGIQQLFDDQWLDPIASVLLGMSIAEVEKS